MNLEFLHFPSFQFGSAIFLFSFFFFFFFLFHWRSCNAIAEHKLKRLQHNIAK